MDSEVTSWLSLDWFSMSTFRSFTWELPIFLYLLAAVPLLFLLRWLLRYKFNQKLPVAVTSRDLHVSPLTLIRLLPEVILAAALSLILLALARPQKTNEKVEQWTEGIDIMLGLDISQSMQIEDFKPNRLEAAKDVARGFIEGRAQDRIGIVVFSGDAFSLAPLTTDYDLLKSYIDDINFEMIENRGTAIGSALAVVTNRMGESEAKSKVCILLSDGDNTAGNIDPITAAELASAYGIKIYTIVVGETAAMATAATRTASGSFAATATPSPSKAATTVTTTMAMAVAPTAARTKLAAIACAISLPTRRATTGTTATAMVAARTVVLPNPAVTGVAIRARPATTETTTMATAAAPTAARARIAETAPETPSLARSATTATTWTATAAAPTAAASKTAATTSWTSANCATTEIPSTATAATGIATHWNAAATASSISARSATTATTCRGTTAAATA
jgi:Ca-activated chloride channel family protein